MPLIHHADNLKVRARQFIALARPYSQIILIASLGLIGLSAISIAKYTIYNSFSYDMGIYAQSAWLISHFQVPYSTIRELVQTGDHVSPVFILISLPYRLFNSPAYLLVIQALSISLGAIPIWLIGKQLFQSKKIGSLFAIAYFLQIGVLYPITFDFHLAALSIGFVSWTIYCWYTNRFRWYLVFLTLSLMCKEDISVLFGAFSLLLFYRRQWRWAIVTLLASLTWYVLSIQVISPWLLGHTYHYNDISPGNLNNNIQPKFDLVKQTLQQQLFLSMLSPLGWVFIGANFASRLLSSISGRWDVIWHYGANISAPLIIASMLGLDQLKKWLKLDQSAVAVIACLVVVASLWTLPPIFSSLQTQQLSPQTMQKVLRHIPATASVSAQDTIAPHLANRQEIYQFPRIFRSCQGDQCLMPEYIVITPKLTTFPINPDQLQAAIDQLSDMPQYQHSEESGVHIFKLQDPETRYQCPEAVYFRCQPYP